MLMLNWACYLSKSNAKLNLYDLITRLESINQSISRIKEVEEEKKSMMMMMMKTERKKRKKIL